MWGQKHVRTVMVILVAVVGYLWYQCLPPSLSDEVVFITIPKGSTLSQAASQLKSAGIIRSDTALKLYMRLKGLADDVKPGTHRFYRRLPVAGISAELVRSTRDSSVITVPEGFTIAQIQNRYNLLKEKTGDRFCYLTLNVPVGSVSFIPSDSMEGYLFPDTYPIAEEDEMGLIRQMTSNFERKVILNYREEIAAAGEKYFHESDFYEALYKIVTVASLIEREAKVPSERPIIASVIYNRLEKGMRLQIDATVSYVPGRSTNNKEKTTLSDTKKKTEYNTYRIDGLPAGPICNPGLECIRAAFEPARTDYLYYVARKDGSHVFTRSFAEHKKEKARVK
ncbi:MAG: endolytic transglycosylase MltG [Abditibacteriota bacterium]|nr:endolytic transglycosylase MltG [Abditibacteriota bacterium]